MDISSLTISLPIAVSLGGLFIGIMTLIGNRKKQTKEDTQKERENEARLVRMETMLTNIDHNTSNLAHRVDKHDNLLTKHETRISVLEKSSGGK